MHDARETCAPKRIIIYSGAIRTRLRDPPFDITGTGNGGYPPIGQLEHARSAVLFVNIKTWTVHAPDRECSRLNLPRLVCRQSSYVVFHKHAVDTAASFLYRGGGFAESESFLQIF